MLKKSPATILGACFSIQAIGIGAYISYGVFFNPLIQEFGWPRAVVSGASSMAFFISGVFAVLIGRLNDRIGPRKVMMMTALFFGAGFMLMAKVTAVWEMYLYFGLIFGIGLSSIDVIALSTVARWFPHKRGIMTGITKVGTGAGQLVFPLLASALIAGYGWQNAYLFVGAISLVLLLGIALILKKEPDTPRGPATTCDDTPNTASCETDLTFSQSARTFQLWLICFINMAILTCLLSVLVHIVAHARDIGIPTHMAAGVLSTIGGASMIGRFITGMVIDKIGSKRSMTLSLLVLVCGLLILNTADTTALLYFFAVIYGLAHGGFFTVLSPIAAELFGVRAHGSIFGLIVFFGCTGGGIGPVLTGYLFDTTGSYSLPFLLFFISSLIGLCLLFFLKPLKSR